MRHPNRDDAVVVPPNFGQQADPLVSYNGDYRAKILNSLCKLTGAFRYNQPKEISAYIPLSDGVSIGTSPDQSF